MDYIYKVSLFCYDDLLFYLSVNKYILETGDYDKPYIRIYADTKRAYRSIGYAFFRTHTGMVTFLKMLRFCAYEYDTGNGASYTVTHRDGDKFTVIDRGTPRG